MATATRFLMINRETLQLAITQKIYNLNGWACYGAYTETGITDYQTCDNEHAHLIAEGFTSLGHMTSVKELYDEQRGINSVADD